MSSAHRPTWAPAQGKEGRQGTRSFSARDLASHTRLKFRQPGQGTTDEHARRDLKLELLQAEQDAAARKARGERGYVPDTKLLALQQAHDRAESDAQSEVASKRQRMLQEAADLDKDDSDDDDGDAGGDEPVDKGKGKAVDAASDGDGDDSDDDDSDDDEDETAELLRELEKIKKERAEEKERQERERAADEQVSRDEEIATGNPLLNLQAALGASPAPSTLSSSTNASFGVKRRWDEDVIFKNQARGVDETPKAVFINDLGRSSYHKKFMSKFIA